VRTAIGVNTHLFGLEDNPASVRRSGRGRHDPRRRARRRVWRQRRGDLEVALRVLVRLPARRVVQERPVVLLELGLAASRAVAGSGRHARAPRERRRRGRGAAAAAAAADLDELPLLQSRPVVLLDELQVARLAVRAGAQVPEASGGLLVVDDVEALAVRALGGLDGPLARVLVQVHAVRPGGALAGVLLLGVVVDVVLGALGLAEVVLDGDDGPVRHLLDDVHGPRPPVLGHAGRPQERADGVFDLVGLGGGRHARRAGAVVEADVLRAVGASGPAVAELDAIAAARGDEGACRWCERVCVVRGERMNEWLG